ncbi:YiiX/YebB-like N1pC/P60 family cysteine hydrolase [Asticcacaulis sp. AND118]|uniref:YiiX/YebB-like N1pC/P60 family cysteine hydrolase n=1 Tax=Asticcacaulis sp. AND118 TaxID=2840468 RepID=UPI0021078376|nr:YiiX/YebB-like N1pC/P60 family cysteine hydrolase [Asticcacaulis sp. AND118]
MREWRQRGKFARIAVYRPKGLTAGQTRQVFTEARRLYGRPYDVYFSFENRAIYCSELAYLAYDAAGIELGERQRIGDLGVLKGPAKDLIAKRAAGDPECRGLDREACIARVLARELVTPVSIARDRNLKKVYSNYPI